MAVILFYSPFHKRARDVESVMLRFKSEGHHVLSLNQRPDTEFNPYVQSKGIQVFEREIIEGNVISLIDQILFLIRFCRKHRVDLIFSHLDSPSFVSSIAQYFIRGKVYLCRHHIDEAALYNYHRSWSYRLTHFLAKRIIVVSEHARRYMVEVEKVPVRKVIHINLAYDFSLYVMPSDYKVADIRAAYGEGMLAVTVCRLTKYKRPDICIEVIRRLRQEGILIRLLILGAGPMKSDLESLIKSYNLQDDVKLLGHVNNPLDFIAASDIMIHPSVLESSCVVLKEAGLLRKPVMVCGGIGDVDEYVIDRFNGFLFNPDSFEQQAIGAIRSMLSAKVDVEGMGDRLRTDIIKNFSIDNVFLEYQKILDAIKT